MAGNNKDKKTSGQSERIAPSLDSIPARVSRAVGSRGSARGQTARVEQRSNISSPKQSSRSPATAKATPGTKPRAATTKKIPAIRLNRPNPPAPYPNPRDVRAIQWMHDKWKSLEPHHQQRVFSIGLLCLSLLLFASLTVLHNQPIFRAISRVFLDFFGWSTYLLALGLVAFAMIHLIEGMHKQQYLRWSLVIGLIVLWFLVLLESRLIVGPHVGILAELLVMPFLGWPPAIAHVMTLGLILITTILTFRITFGHVLLFADAVYRLFTDEPRVSLSSKTPQPSPFLGQRPRYSRYAAGNLVDADQREPTRAKRRPVADEEEDEGAVAFEPDFGLESDDDPLDDINIHKREIGTVPHGSSRVPEPLDAEEHKRAIQGIKQQELPLQESDQALKGNRTKIAAKHSPEMEPLPLKSHPASQKKARPAEADVVLTRESTWAPPGTALFNTSDTAKLQIQGGDTGPLAKVIQDTLRSFRVDAEVRPEDISIGPTIIRFGIRPTGKPEMRKDEKTGKIVPVVDAAGQIIYETRTRVSRIMALQNDLALVLEAKTIRMEAPVPGRPYVGVEIPNKNSRLVTLREVLESKEYQAAREKSKLAIGLGKDVAGLVRVGDLARMPHLLIAGATGAGKCLAYDEPIFLADGQVVKVQELIGRSVQVIGIADTQTMQQTPVTATFTENGVQEVFEIKLDNGVVLRRTGEHPLWAACLDENQHVGRQSNGKAVRRTRAIKAGWVQAKDLRICGNRPNFDGHVILCPLALQQRGMVSRSDADVIICAALIAEGGLNTTGRANLLGRSMGTPRFTNADPSMVELVATAVKDYGCQLVVSPHKVKGNIDYYISQISRKGRNAINPIAQLVCDWGINCLATQKRIPDWVFQLSNKQIALFLQVFIDCDGWFDATIDRIAAVNVTLANPVLIQQIGQLALRLGIVGSYTFKDNGYAGAWTWSSRMVAEWQERIGSIVKAEKLARAVKEQARQRELAATEWNGWRQARPIVGQKFSDCPPGYEWRKIVAVRRITVPTVNIEVHSDNHAFVGYAVEHNSVMINTIIASIIAQATPDDVRLLMVDPKMVELNMYNGIPHLLSPVVIEVDKVVSLLKNAINEMERRYRLFSQLGVRNLDGYRKLRQQKFEQGDTSLNNLPAIVIIIDELADLMMAAPEEVEGMICRLAQLARATGIHLVVATQRPSVDVITGLIKANIPTRISFMVSSAVDSRTIIDMGGAERLLGRGDMLYLPADAGRPERIQGAFLSDEEANTLADYWRQQIVEHAVTIGEEPAQVEAQPAVEPGWELKNQMPQEFELDDDLLDKAEDIVREYGRASISLLQRRLRVGYSRAARLIDLLEQRGIIGQSESGGRGREVYDSGQGNGYTHRGSGDGHSMADVVEDIVAEERARDEFLRKQAARFQPQSEQGALPRSSHEDNGKES